MAGFTTFHRVRLGFVIGLICALLASTLVNLRPSPFAEKEELTFSLSTWAERAEMLVFDLRMKLFASENSSESPLVMVNVDDETLLGLFSRTRPWPWKRSVVSEILTELTRLGAKGVVVDPILIQPRVSFSEESEFAALLAKHPEVIIGFEHADLSVQMSAPAGRFAFPLGVYPTREAAFSRISQERPRLGLGFYLLEATAEDAAISDELKAEALEAAQVGKTSATEGASTKVAKPKAKNTSKKAKKTAASAKAGKSASTEKVQADSTQTPSKFLGYTLWMGGMEDRESAQKLAPGQVAQGAIRELTRQEIFSRISSEQIFAELASLKHEDVPTFPENFIPPRRVSTALLSGKTPFASFDLTSDFDGVIRKAPLVIHHGGKLYPTPALAVARLLKPDAPLTITPTHILWDDKVFSLDDQGNMGLRFYGGSGLAKGQADLPFEEISAASIFQSISRHASGRVTDRAIRDAIEGKVVFLAPTSSILHGNASTPVGDKTIAFVWAMAVEDMMRGTDFIRVERTFDRWLTFALALLGSLVGAFCLRVLRPGVTLMNWLVLGGGIVVIFGFYQEQTFENGVLVSVVLPLLAFFVSSGVTFFYVSFDAMRAVGRIWDAIGRHTPLKLTEALLVAPQKLNLAGEHRTVTLLDCDLIRFSERFGHLAPQELVNAMRDVWACVSNEICHAGGQVDHVVGDAMLAYWGAPLDNRRHAYDACRCALAMKGALRRRQKAWKERYGIQVEIALSLVTDEVIMGDFGCGGVRPMVNYTAMGRAILRTKRLNALSERWKGVILMSEGTQKILEKQVESRCLGVTRIGGDGICEYMPVYELLALKGGLNRSERTRIAKYKQAVTLVSQRQFKEAKALLEEVVKAKPDDMAATVLITRCDQFIAVPPPEGWQGFVEIS